MVLIVLWWPGTEAPESFSWLPERLDLAVHLALFVPGGFLLGTVRRRIVPPWVELARILGFAGLVGAVTEIGQVYVPGRGAAWEDLLADLVGACLGWWLSGRWRPARPALGEETGGLREESSSRSRTGPRSSLGAR